MDADFTSTTLSPCVVSPDALSAAEADAMFALFARYYANVTRAKFEADLRAKDSVLLIERDNALAGFTTAATTRRIVGGHELVEVFSGDTVVDHAYWGEQVLGRAWPELVGRAARRFAPLPLYWLLIVKGHRTYRYLPAFAQRYVPSGGTDDGELMALRDALAAERFGEAYDRASGVLRFDAPRGNLATEWAEPSAREMRLAEVRRFLAANPGSRQGDELACLCSLARANMKPRAQRWYDNGWADAG